LPVEEACNVLINNNISSAPVYDAEVKTVSEQPIVHARSYVGMFDYGDVIAYILLVLQNMPPPGENEDDQEEYSRENLTFEIKDIVRRALEGEEVPVKLASGKITNEPFNFVSYGDV
jgi:CBS domain-containing protein